MTKKLFQFTLTFLVIGWLMLDSCRRFADWRKGMSRVIALFVTWWSLFSSNIALTARNSTNLFNKRWALLASMAFFLLACGDGLSMQDVEFVAKIKSHLSDVGDKVKLADIYPGEWEYVCINPISAYSTIEVESIEGVGFRPNGIEIINGPVNTYADDTFWGLYFRYAGNRAEYYRIHSRDMSGYLGSYTNKDNCLLKEEAYLVVKENARMWGEKLPDTLSKDWIDVRLINSGEIK